ncbi:hypothetical protein DSC45_23495 [Streptomyces sp. YIM 130001]|uniref:hypothetical protein n=1 Tax=Streptomyces sp. YIM 130001 TaxID=2259644 RepID=UPI000E64E392|nr:hypothetical protein [Streptomyces sp. YIM 130001]RII13529.1 hypothetical protein DSC45_23495 [Streptomyces sp. YIM 130001]
MSLGDEHGGRSDDGFGDDARMGYGGTGQTRTRLPERDEPYGNQRRTPRSSRSLITVVAIVVLLIAAIAFANRGSDGKEEGADASSGGKPGAAPTAASGEKPVEGKNGAIPSGFAHSKQGAESAAANYAVALVSADILKPDKRAGIVDRVFVPAKAPELEAKFDKAYSKAFLGKLGLDEKGNAAKGQTYVSRTAPIGTKTVSYATDKAAVDVWCTGVFGTAGDGSESPVTSDWFTMKLKLQWTGEDWQVEGFSQQPGPAPVNGDNKVSGADEIAGAVEQYGGFTYAR